MATAAFSGHVNGRATACSVTMSTFQNPELTLSALLASLRATSVVRRLLLSSLIVEQRPSSHCVRHDEESVIPDLSRADHHYT